MTISEAGKQFGLTPDTLRFYEKSGIIKPNRKASGIRDYNENDIKTLEFVICMRKAGLTIEVLKEYLNLYAQGDKTIPARISLLKKQLEELKKKDEDIRKSIERLTYKIDNYSKILQKEKDI
jgi:DNA-binding transcriptional MerR regulator